MLRLLQPEHKPPWPLASLTVRAARAALTVTLAIHLGHNPVYHRSTLVRRLLPQELNNLAEKLTPGTEGAVSLTLRSSLAPLRGKCEVWPAPRGACARRPP